ncbi:hypothetical protein P3L51_32685 [Streptomyces sp. PSRA5]|uniref:hypothetical protein n=1 Tax=Streptomyces panacea TaxID=3035064 RepID=UPI00339D0568
METTDCGGGIDFLELLFGDTVGEILRMFAQIAMEGAFAIFQAVGDIGSHEKGTSDVINRQTQWIVVYLAVGSILFAAVKMALDRRGEAGQTALKGVLRITLVNTAATSVIITFATLMDRYSSYLFTGALENLMNGIECGGDISAMLLLIIACLLIISGVIHALLMWIRLGVMIILMGTLPVAAAASMTDWGATWWRKHIGWLVAWLLYKPTVSLVLYSGSVMVNAKGVSQVNTQIAGMGVLLLSAISLPALMRVIVPATEALGGDSAGQATMGVAGGIASGAKSLGGGAINLAAAALSGSQSPSGASSNSASGAASQGGGGSSTGGGSSSGGGSSPSGGGGSSSGIGAAAAKAAPIAGAAASTASKVAKGMANVIASGVEGANRNPDR